MEEGEGPGSRYIIGSNQRSGVALAELSCGRILQIKQTTDFCVVLSFVFVK